MPVRLLPACLLFLFATGLIACGNTETPGPSAGFSGDAADDTGISATDDVLAGDGVDSVNDLAAACSPADCDDKNPCTKENCVPGVGCVYANSEAKCDDNDTCTTNDFCTAGVCSGTPFVCNDANPCTSDSCKSGTGCVFTPNSVTCTDGDLCTSNDHCKDGACVGLAESCSATSVCETSGGCNPKTGCIFTTNSGPCDDKNECTNEDFCANGTCIGVAADCNDNNPCTNDGCNQIFGCTHVANESPCSDGDLCTKDQCTNGKCVSTPDTCNDGNFCTDDGCDLSVGCTHTFNSLGCDDGSSCTSGETCSEGKCVGLINCADDNPCTIDKCQGTTGCVHIATSDACNDGDACTGDDVCGFSVIGVICKGKQLNCDDNNTCTTDSCVPGAGCLNALNSLACDDGSACTSADKCTNGLCIGVPKVCSDGIFCTSDACVDGNCVYLASDVTCNDGDACTSGDACSGGACTGSASVICNDNNGCTYDSCNPTTGCKFFPTTDTCDDGNVCTSNDACASGTCSGTPYNCDDGNACTTETCVPGGDLPSCDTKKVEDGTACSAATVCEAGVCVSGASPGGMVSLTGGTFNMGNASIGSYEVPVHEVTLSAFELDAHEVTVLEYATFYAGLADDKKCTTQNNGSLTCARPGTVQDCNWNVDGRTNHPITCVDWYMAKAYCDWAGKRLPTEAEWEYAARNQGQDVAFPWGNEAPSCSYAILADPTNGCGQNSTSPVASLAAGKSAQGLYDMAGNVMEWCADTFAAYTADAQVNPLHGAGATGFSMRVVRGSMWKTSASDLGAVNAAYRDQASDNLLYYSMVGFRCAKNISP